MRELKKKKSSTARNHVASAPDIAVVDHVCFLGVAVARKGHFLERQRVRFALEIDGDLFLFRQAKSFGR